MDQLTKKRYRIGIKGHPLATFVDGHGRSCLAPGRKAGDLRPTLAPTVVVEGLSADDAKGVFQRQHGITQTVGEWLVEETSDPVTPLAPPTGPPEKPDAKPAKAGK